MVIKNILNPEGHQNCMSGSEVTAILLKGCILPIAKYWWSCIRKGLRLRPAQQACLNTCQSWRTSQQFIHLLDFI